MLVLMLVHLPHKMATSGISRDCDVKRTISIDAYRRYEALRMLNLLTVLSVRLLARVPTVLTVLAVPVLELELVFERTPSDRDG